MEKYKFIQFPKAIEAPDIDEEIKEEEKTLSHWLAPLVMFSAILSLASAAIVLGVLWGWVHG